MKRSNTNDGRKISKFLSVLVKALGIFLLCSAHFYCGQVYVSEGVAIHVKEGAEIIQDHKTETVRDNIIYITAETSISNLAGGNFEVVKIFKTKKNLITAASPSKKKKISSVKTEPAPVKLVQNKETPNEVFSSSSDPGSIFSSRQDSGMGIFHSPTSTAKYILKPIHSDAQISTSELSKVEISGYSADYKTKRDFLSFSIRPPPAFL